MGRDDGDTVLPRLTDHSIADALAQATTGHALAPREGPVLLAHVLQRGRTWLIAHADTLLSPTQRAHFERLVRRRQHGEPLAYLVGEREFFGHRIAVSPSVLIPRPETELLVEWSITQLLPRAHVLELATGSGAVAIALALARPDCQILATDRSHCALAVARANARRLLAQTPDSRQTACSLRRATGMGRSMDLRSASIASSPTRPMWRNKTRICGKVTCASSHRVHWRAARRAWMPSR